MLDVLVLECLIDVELPSVDVEIHAGADELERFYLVSEVNIHGFSDVPLEMYDHRYPLLARALHYYNKFNHKGTPIYLYSSCFPQSFSQNIDHSQKVLEVRQWTRHILLPLCNIGPIVLLGAPAPAFETKYDRLPSDMADS